MVMGTTGKGGCNEGFPFQDIDAVKSEDRVVRIGLGLETPEGEQKIPCGITEKGDKNGTPYFSQKKCWFFEQSFAQLALRTPRGG